MMQFGNLQYLWLLALTPLLGIFYIFCFKSKRTALRRFADEGLLERLLWGVNAKNQRLKPVLITGVFFFLILSLIEPKWGYKWEEMKRRGVDIIVALDVSESMLSEDIKPNRLQSAKREIKSLINILKGDRIGLIAFSGKGFVKCPLTLDYGVAKTFLDDIDIDAIPVPGTDIGGAIDLARKAFAGFEKKHRVMILITDGEDHEDRVLKAVDEAKKEGIVIFTIGVGTSEGAPIPIVGEDGNRAFLKDRSGNIILTKLDPVILQKIALLTGGKMGSIGGGQFPLEDIYLDQVQKMEKKELESTRHRRYENRFQVPLYVALVILLLEGLISERRRVT